MKLWIASVIAASTLAAASNALAQETSTGPGKVEVSIIPGGATFVTSKGDAPDFQNYDAGATLGFNFGRVIGVEGEVMGSFGLEQSLHDFGGLIGEFKSPNTLSYTANLVAMLPGHSVVPYATGGVGGTTLYQRELLGILNTDTFFTSNLGGGVKWYSSGGRWGLRGDYRVQFLKSRDNAPDFFGIDDRISHRVYGAFVINVVK